MPFTAAQATLESLEWAEVLAQLADRARTPGARRILAESPLFETTAAGVRERLAETAEALALLEQGAQPPLGGVAELAPLLARARKQGSLEPEELLAVAGTLAAFRNAARVLARGSEPAPGLADLARTIALHPALHAEIEASIDASGNVRDDASATLADARRERHRLAGEIQRRADAMLRDRDVVAHLSDAWSTVRNDRTVLPVRADARGAVRGIVHDASRSGTTLFIEPEALVELNNRSRQASFAADAEVRRILRELSRAVCDAADEIEAGLAALASIDLAFARAQLGRDWHAVRPEVLEQGVVSLPQLRHPMLPADEAVPNDLRVGGDYAVLVLSGPNAGGKTVAMKSLALAVLCARAGLFVPAEAPARIDLFDAVVADIGDAQDIREHLSTFSAHMAKLSEVAARADARTLAVLDEIGTGTDPGEGAALAQAVLETLAEAGARVVTTTHFGLLKELAEVDERFANASFEFDPETLAPTFRLRMGLPGISSATAVAARMGMPRAVLDRTEALLSREDRKLDRMLGELASSRAALEGEKRAAERVRLEGEAARSAYATKLERLRERRDEMTRAMHAELDREFRQAREEVARVVRELQGGARSRDAERAREELRELESRARDAAPPGPATGPQPEPLDWSRARPGDAVDVAGSGAATLVSLPDRKGRVAVRLGSARVELPMERVGASREPRPDSTPTQRPPQQPLGLGGTARCDLRGLRVDEALDRLEAALDTAASEGRERLEVIHGVGTGALRRAVRERLARSPGITLLPGDPGAGGDGLTTIAFDG